MSHGSLPLLHISASYDEANNRGAVFLVDRSQQKTVATDVVWQGAAPSRAPAIYQQSVTDPKAINAFE